MSAERGPQRTVWVLGAFLFGVALIAGAAVLWMPRDHGLPDGPGDAPTAQRARSDGVPALQTAPQPDGAAHRAAAQRELAQLAPAPGEPGYARIPIERAMALLAETGLRAPVGHVGETP